MSYAILERHYRRLADLQHVEAITGWDEATMMAPGGGEARGEALATLRGIIHAHATTPVLEPAFATAEAELAQGALSHWQAANVREMRRSWIRATAVPADLVEAVSRAESRSEQAWRKLRPANDWEGFRPLLEEVVARKRDVAAVLSDRLALSPYDALLDGYEPGARSAHIASLFAELGAFLPNFIEAVIDRQRGETVLLPEGPFPVEQQRSLGVALMEHTGFDFRHGRLDVSHHPFCGGVPDDVRITTRYDPANFVTALMGVMHETGHAKYEQNLPREWLGQPVGQARGMAMHESQSLLQEMQVCRGREFLAFARPLILSAFPDAAARSPEAFRLENLERLYTRVKRDYIRVNADEVTYPCHVILRFEIEKPLIEGSLRVSDIPELWDSRMRALLGLSTAGDYRNGCMQDVHWPAGLFGYFPTYTLGALSAAQLFAAARRDVAGLDSSLERGDFSGLNAWLKQRVWSLGSLLDTEEIVRQATGAPLGIHAFEAHLRRRYLNC